jgi:hypothetical protein
VTGTFADLLGLDVVGLTIRCLAVVGGGVMGGLATSWLGRLLLKPIRSQPLSSRARKALFGLGGIAAGWVVALFLFSGGSGSGVGGPGGSGLGAPEGQGERGGDAVMRPRQLATETDKTASTLFGTELRVEVLGDDTLRKLRGKSDLDTRHCYRIAGEQPPTLRTLDAIKQLILRRLGEKPPLERIEVVLYRDSPDRRVPRVADLERWLDELATQKPHAFIYLVNDKLAEDAPVQR